MGGTATSLAPTISSAASLGMNIEARDSSPAKSAAKKWMQLGRKKSKKSKMNIDRRMVAVDHEIVRPNKKAGEDAGEDGGAEDAESEGEDVTKGETGGPPPAPAER